MNNLNILEVERIAYEEAVYEYSNCGSCQKCGGSHCGKCGGGTCAG